MVHACRCVAVLLDDGVLEVNDSVTPACIECPEHTQHMCVQLWAPCNFSIKFKLKDNAKVYKILTLIASLCNVA